MKYDLLTNLWRSEFWIGLLALAAFLVGTWVLRGAPPGQAGEAEDDEGSPRAGYRDRIIVGVVLGMLIILAGAYIALVRGVLWSLPAFGVGFALVLLLIAYNRRYRHASPSLRRTIELSTAFLNAALLAGILIVANVIAFRYGGQPIDVTREGSYTLSSQTHNVLRNLDRPVNFIMVSRRVPGAATQHDRIVQLLDTYKAANPQLITQTNLDPYTEVSRADELARRVPELELLHRGGVVIEYGAGDSAQYVVVRNQDLFTQAPPAPGQSGSDRFTTIFTGENEITSALIRLKEGKKTRIGFTTGHGEPSTADLNPRGRGVGNWRARFTKVGCEVVDIPLANEDIPRDLSLLAVVGPRSPFKPEEVLKLRSFADRGGPLLILLGNAEPSGLDEFLKLFNLEIGRGVIVDAKYYYRDQSLVWAPLQAGVRHPIMEPLGINRAVLLPAAAPIKVLGQSPPSGSPSTPTNPDLLPTPILQTSQTSWAETDPRTLPWRFDAKTEQQGPLLVGVAVAQRPAAGRGSEPTPRLVLFSCPGLAENYIQDLEHTNVDVLMNAASWLRGKPDTQGLEPHQHVAMTLAIDRALRSRLILVPSVTAAMLIIAMGIIIYVARRE